jgi:hypothetical protein
LTGGGCPGISEGAIASGAAELLAHIAHRRAAERAGLLNTHPTKLQALELAGTPAVHDRQQRGLGADPAQEDLFVINRPTSPR